MKRIEFIKINEFISGSKHQNKILLKNVKLNLNCFGHTHERLFFVLIKYSIFFFVTFRSYIMHT